MQKGITQHENGTVTIWTANFMFGNDSVDRFVDCFAQDYKDGYAISDIYEVSKDQWLELGAQWVIDGLHRLDTFTDRTGIAIGTDIARDGVVTEVDTLTALALELECISLEELTSVAQWRTNGSYEVSRGHVKRMPWMTYHPVYGTPLWKDLLHAGYQDASGSELADIYQTVIGKRVH